MNNNKGFTLVEMLVSFVIVSVIAGIMMNVLLTVKDRSEKSYSLTQIAMTQANIAKTIKNDLKDYTLTNVAECGVNCYDFTYTTLGVKRLSLNENDNTVTYGTYIKKIPDGGLIGATITLNNTKIANIPSGNSSIFKLTIPINNMYNDNSNDVVVIHQYSGSIGL